jgi:hypothetical protein
MRWIDQDSYVGPDRRAHAKALRFIERRREDLAGAPPPLTTALRQMRQYVIDARGKGAAAFAVRAEGVAALARHHGRPEVSATLMRVAAVAPLGATMDVRNDLLELLDRAQQDLS